MNHKKSFNIDEKLLEKIISVAYGNAGFFVKKEVKNLAEKHPEVKEILEEYTQTASELKNLKFDECPDEIIQNVEKTINLDEKPKRSFIFDLGLVLSSKPIYSAAAVAVLVIAIVFSSLQNKQYNQNEFSQQEVEIASQQVEQALALIGKVFNDATSTIKKDILAKRVSKPLNESIESVNELFPKENKDEKLN